MSEARLHDPTLDSPANREKEADAMKRAALLKAIHQQNGPSQQVPASLVEQIMQEVPDRERFTGQVTLEIHCRVGEVRDVFLTTRRKTGET